MVKHRPRPLRHQLLLVRDAVFRPGFRTLLSDQREIVLHVRQSKYGEVAQIHYDPAPPYAILMVCDLLLQYTVTAMVCRMCFR